jgi:hypothetical protein
MHVLAAQAVACSRGRLVKVGVLHTCWAPDTRCCQASCAACCAACSACWSITGAAPAQCSQQPQPTFVKLCLLPPPN